MSEIEPRYLRVADVCEATNKTIQQFSPLNPVQALQALTVVSAQIVALNFAAHERPRVLRDIDKVLRAAVVAGLDVRGSTERLDS